MKFFEYPYVIITILAMIGLVAVLVGLYFTMQSVITAKGSAQKGFCGLGKLESDFEKAAAERKNRCVVYIAVSLDNLKRLHSEGKAGRVGEQIKQILLRRLGLNADGEICLYGKEHFVALNSMTEAAVESCLDAIRAEIDDLCQKHDAVNAVRVKFGYHRTESTEVSFKTALDRAKQACSMAEDKGVPYCCWDSQSGKEFQRKLSMENSIRTEIENNRFFLEYQPLVDAKTDKIMGAEVLARLNSPTEGILTPRVFLAAVSNVGLNRTFDYYIFEKNCKWIASDRERRMRYVYTINFSRHTLCDPELAERIIRIVEEYGINSSCIAVEILEDKTLNREETDVMTENLARLKEKGVLVLLDDFGKGVAGFGDLTDFDIGIVKIDKSITQNATAPAGQAILKNIIKTAHDLGFRALCEGIESEEQKHIAVDAGCDILQGYHLYRPMAVTQFESLFEA